MVDYPRPTTWPSARCLSSLPLLLAQCALLHPTVPSRLSSFLRLALLPPTFILALTAPWHDAFEPRERCRAINAVLAMVSVYASWKALEWGMEQDRKVYAWVGCEEKARERGSDGMTPDEPTRSPTREGGWADTARLVVDTIHLFTSMRGAGYAFSIVPARRGRRVDRTTFVFNTLVVLAWSHSILLLCSIVISTPFATRSTVASTHVPRLSTLHAHVLLESTSYVAFGLGAWTGIVSFSSVANLLSVATHSFLLVALPNAVRPGPFDSRHYAPMFDMPFAPRSVGKYWASQWHRLFWRSFKFLAYDPVERLVRPIAGCDAAKAAGSMAVFALSAAAHEYAIWCATFGLLPPATRTTFLERFGATLFFLLMGVLGIAERIYTHWTGFRIRGFGAFLWTSTLQSLVGLLLYRSWANLGFTSSLPQVDEWAWQRWVVPLACLAPRPLWVRSEV